MDLKDLEIFKEVARQQNITKAAAHFNYVQSNITSRLSKLEKEVGKQLLTRTNKGVFLTNQGELFLQYVNRMLHLQQEALQALHAESPSGELVIGATDMMTATRLPKLLTNFMSTFPSIEVQLTNASTEQLVKDVLNFHVEGAFVTDAINHPQIEFEPLATEELVVISSNSHRTIQWLGDIENKTMLVFKEGCTYRRKVEEWMKREDAHLRKIEFGTIEGMVGCVKAGLGVAVVSKQLATDVNTMNELQFHETPIAYRYAETGFIYRSDIEQTLALQKFLAQVKAAYMNC